LAVATSIAPASVQGIGDERIFFDVTQRRFVADSRAGSAIGAKTRVDRHTPLGANAPRAPAKGQKVSAADRAGNDGFILRGPAQTCAVAEIEQDAEHQAMAS